jgi:hypothetical protein
MDNERDNPEGGKIEIRLDGSYGAGPVSELTIITRTEGGGQREEIFQVPYFMIDTKRLQAFNDINLILGYKLVKGEKTPPGLKELGL